MGHFGRKPIRISWIYFVLPALLLNYMGQGAMILSADAGHGAGQGQGSVLLSGSRHAAAAAGAARDRGDDHRQPGGDLGRLFGDPAGDPARLRAAPPDHPHQRKRGRADLHPDRQLGADDHGHHAGADLPQLVQPRRGLWHRRRRRDDHRQRADLGRAAPNVELEPLRRCRPAAALLHRRLRLSLSQPPQDPGWRLVPAAGRRDRLHLPHHLGEGPPADDQPHERGEPADGDLHQVGGAERGARVPAQRCS